MRKSFEFGKIAYGNTNRKNNLVTVEIELKKKNCKDCKDNTEKEMFVFSASGNIWNSKQTDIVSGGQNLDEIAKYVKDPIFMEIFRIWKEYHLNDLKAGNEEQIAIIKEWRNTTNTKGWAFENEVEHLKSIGKYDINGFRWGSGWWCTEIPQSEIEKIQNLLNL